MSLFEKSYEGKWEKNSLDYLALQDHWHVVARSDSVLPECKISSKLMGEKIVIWRSAKGDLHAWQDYCAHRGAPLSLGKVSGCKIVCPYHGWHFDGQGKCVLVPAHPDQLPPEKSAVRKFRVTEKYEFIWVSLGEPERAPPRLPFWDDDSYRKVASGPYFYNANALRCMDNFLDASHFPHVHSGINGSAEKPDVTIQYQVIEKDGELQTTEFTVFQPFADARGLPIEVRYHYYCLAPTVAYSDKETGMNQHWFTWCAITPVDVDKAIFWLVMSFNYGHEIDEQKIHDRQAKVFGEQDRWIVESQRPVSMPLNVNEELHVVSDRLGVAYRKWLAAKGQKKRSTVCGSMATQDK